jgi:23S rRNA pseudouridine2605 synthase
LEKQPLIKVLTASGIGSRRQLTAAIKRGGVAVNGQSVENFNEPVNTESDVITVDGKRVNTRKEPNIYLMLNKPPGIITSLLDEQGRKTVNDILPTKYCSLRLYPVGRLDKDSTGLVLLTNDGDLTFRLTHPRFGHDKEYLVRIDGKLQPEEVRSLEQGISLEDGKTAPANIKMSKYPGYNYSLTIHEGRKRQVRRMFAALGHTVTALRRIRFSSLKLGALPEGEVRELTPEELKMLKRA